jgi:hypothetical protein
MSGSAALAGKLQRMLATATSAAPLACVAAATDGAARRRKDGRLAAVLAEFGYRTLVVNGEQEAWLAEDAKLVVCDLVNPCADIPIEVALASTRGAQVLVLVPEGVPIDGMAASLLADCGATVMRYDGVEPHRVLHARLLALA